MRYYITRIEVRQGDFTVGVTSRDVIEVGFKSDLTDNGDLNVHIFDNIVPEGQCSYDATVLLTVEVDQNGEQIREMGRWPTHVS
jgi:hypothetical protein